MTGTKSAEFRLLHIANALQCRFVSRVNRFVLRVQAGNDYYLAHNNNTGRLLEFLIEGNEGFCVPRTTGKTQLRLFAFREGNLGAIIDTQLQMRAFERALEASLIPWLKGYKAVKRNARLGDSLIDYLLEHGGEKVYLEVKSAVLRGGDRAMYPDCPSLRGRKHIRELTGYVRRGGEAIILFIAALPGVTAFKPNQAADPELCEYLVEAHRAGVKIKSIGMAYHPEDSSVYLYDPDLSIELPRAGD